MELKVFACICALLVSGAAVAAENCAPERMLHAVTAAEFSDLPADAFATKPKVMYRAGNKYGRIEEAESPSENLQLMIVVNEPDVWVVNRSTMQGQHMIDHGPTFDFRAPVISDFKSKHWNAFEFGCEESFMKASGTKPVTDVAGNLRYTHEAEGRKATLYLSRDHSPRRVEIVTPKGTYALKYLQYEWLDLDPKLFERPGKVEYTEEK